MTTPTHATTDKDDMTINLDTLFSSTGYCVVRPIAIIAFGMERAALLDKLYQLIHEPPQDVETLEKDGRRYVKVSAAWLRKRRSFWFWTPRNIQLHFAYMVKHGLILQLKADKKSLDHRRWTALDDDKIIATARERMLRTYQDERDLDIRDAMRSALRIDAKSDSGVGAKRTSHLPIGKTINSTSKVSTAQPTIEHPELFKALADLCELNPTINGKIIAEGVRALTKVEATPEQVSVTFKNWWLSDEWRKNNKPEPTLKDVNENWQKAMKNLRPPKIDATKANWHQNGNGKRVDVLAESNRILAERMGRPTHGND